MIWLTKPLHSDPGWQASWEVHSPINVAESMQYGPPSSKAPSQTQPGQFGQLTPPTQNSKQPPLMQAKPSGQGTAGQRAGAAVVVVVVVVGAIVVVVVGA